MTRKLRIASLVLLASLAAAGALVVASRGGKPSTVALPRAGAPRPVPTPTIPPMETQAPVDLTVPADDPTTQEPDPDPTPESKKPKLPASAFEPIGTIEIPKIALVHPVYEGIDMRILDRGPGHWPGTAMPGYPGNSVFAGHRVSHSRPFRHIDKLVAGDLVHFDIKGKRSTYRVTGDLIVGETDVWIVNQTEEATATIFACHPPGSAKYRYVVRLALAT